MNISDKQKLDELLALPKKMCTKQERIKYNDLLEKLKKPLLAAKMRAAA